MPRALGAQAGLPAPEAEALTLDHLYAALDFLDSHHAAIEREVFFRTADLFRADVDLVFWDPTSVYFAVDDADDAPETRPGTTLDVTTVAQVKNDLWGWKFGRSLFVGDARMDSEANRRELAKGLGHYLLAMSVGKLTEVQAQVLVRPGRFRPVAEQLEVKEVVVGTGERRRRYLVCRNQAEAARQRQHREALLAPLRAELARLDPEAPAHSTRACEVVASHRYGRYLTRGPGGQLTLNPAAMRRAARRPACAFARSTTGPPTASSATSSCACSLCSCSGQPRSGRGIPGAISAWSWTSSGPSARRSSATSRSWRVAHARSIRPLACGLKAEMGSMPSASRARPTWVGS